MWKFYVLIFPKRIWDRLCPEIGGWRKCLC
jgi:hypothetical protein